ncbi:hypothetical protein C8R43DRAFT_1015592 [Mycena crocata]|nr:hypothetical protein C8R43DRAFT_1015592 [Mycena crocata]
MWLQFVALSLTRLSALKLTITSSNQQRNILSCSDWKRYTSHALISTKDSPNFENPRVSPGYPIWHTVTSLRGDY